MHLVIPHSQCILSFRTLSASRHSELLVHLVIPHSQCILSFRTLNASCNSALSMHLVIPNQAEGPVRNLLFLAGCPTSPRLWEKWGFHPKSKRRSLSRASPRDFSPYFQNIKSTRAIWTFSKLYSTHKISHLPRKASLRGLDRILPKQALATPRA